MTLQQSKKDYCVVNVGQGEIAYFKHNYIMNIPAMAFTDGDTTFHGDHQYNNQTIIQKVSLFLGSEFLYDNTS